MAYNFLRGWGGGVFGCGFGKILYFGSKGGVGEGGRRRRGVEGWKVGGVGFRVG